MCLSFNIVVHFRTLHQGSLGECVKLCCSIPILSGKNSVPESARRSISYSFLTLYLVIIHAAFLIVNLLSMHCGKGVFFQVLEEITQCRLAVTRCDARVVVRGVFRDCLLR